MTAGPVIRVRGQSPDVGALDRRFQGRFTVGRGAECELRIESPLASRTHAEVWFENGAWWIRDLGSTNGTLVNGAKVETAALPDGALVQIGKDGPTLLVAATVPHAGPPPAAHPTQMPRAHDPPAVSTDGTTEHGTVASDVPSGPLTGSAPGSAPGSSPPPPPGSPPGSPRPPAPGSPPGPPHPSVDRVIERYFDADSDHPAGEHTRLIRQAYKTVSRRESMKWRKWMAAVGVLLVLAVGFGGFQRFQNQRLRVQAEEIFLSLKELDVTIVNLRRLVEQQGGTELTEQLERLDGQRARLSAQYEGYVRDMGVYRRLRSDEERLIYQTARAFGESETTMSEEFVERVKEEIDGYWRSTGKARFERAIRRAEENEYTPFIVQTLREYGLPPEFFYLALQESDFIPDRVGPQTRWGYAKGAWQFIPTTARRYGLNPGLKADTDAVDPLDERQNFFLATDAASRYLLDLHGTLTQASGLLVMASYNWGEHRVLPRLNDLPTPDAVFDATFEDVPADPEWRNYWKFLGQYGDRMPDETKDYVLKIFSAAVIGKNPRYFGFDFDDPLASYID